MRKFEHYTAESFEEASKALREDPCAKAIAGGTDLLTTMKDEILDSSPKAVISLRTIKGADEIVKEGDVLRIGAMAKLTAIAENETVKASVPGIGEAAYSVATPLVRNLGTIGGNLCQDVRCWYYRYPHESGGRLVCRRKGGDACYAIQGKNRFHSVFGGMSCGGASCASGCPAGTDIPGYLAKVREGNWAEAAEIIMQYNPMPMLTSRVCPHPCQDKCNQNGYGDCVNIHCVERTVAEYIMQHAEDYYKAPEAETGKKAAIIGSGPSGLAAAFYLRKAGHAVTVFESQEKAGGVLQYGIPHYRLPKQYVDFVADALKGMGVEFRFNTEVGKDIPVDEIVAGFDSVFFGTGAWKQPILGLEGENLTQFGLNFLVEVNKYLKGVIGEEVLVCGGGNVAMDVALTACRLGSKKVKLVCLEQEYEMPASKEEIARAKEEGVEILNGWGLSKVLTDEAGKVTGLESRKCVSVRDENGRFAPKYDENEKMTISSDCIILATGQAVDISFLGDKFLTQLKSARGLYDVDLESYKTKAENIYAGGDAATGPNIAIRAIAAGRVAARNMSKDMGTAPEAFKAKTGFSRFDTEGIKQNVSNKAVERPLGERTLTDEDSETMSFETAQNEAKRCMNCGCYSVAPSDLAPMLIAADAVIKTTDREVSAEDLFTSALKMEDALAAGELVTEIDVPVKEGFVSHYDKFRLREAIDWAIVSLGSSIKVAEGTVEEAHLVLGGVAPIPVRLCEVEAFLAGKALTDDVIEEACALAVKDCFTMSENAYKTVEIRTMLKDALVRVR